MKTVINARIDNKLKIQLEELAQQMGLSLSALVSASLTKVAKDRKLELNGLTENGFTPEYENEVLSDPDTYETVCELNSAEDIDTFFDDLQCR